MTDDNVSLLEQVTEMMQMAMLIYGLTDLRQMVKTMNVPEDVKQDILAMPMTAKEMITIVTKHYESIHNYHNDHNILDMYLTAVPDLLQLSNTTTNTSNTKNSNTATNTIQSTVGSAMSWLTQPFLATETTSLGNPLNNTTNTQKSYLDASKLLMLDDEHADTELVYGLGINTKRKRITVCFRGSVTMTDFIMDAKQNFVSFTNPLYNEPSSSFYSPTSWVHIHEGFHEYLFAPQRNNGQSKYDQILAQVLQLVQEYPNYTIHVTGHSLGGALSTLCAFQLAANPDPRIPKPITCISVASPRVGNMEFRCAFQELERQNKLRCLRVFNDLDVVTMLPDRGTWSCAYICCCQTYMYRHVGIQLKLLDTTSTSSNTTNVQIQQSQPFRGHIRQIGRDLFHKMKHKTWYILSFPFQFCSGPKTPLNHHSMLEYLERLQAASSTLKTYTLADLYHQDPTFQQYYS